MQNKLELIDSGTMVVQSDLTDSTDHTMFVENTQTPKHPSKRELNMECDAYSQCEMDRNV